MTHGKRIRSLLAIPLFGLVLLSAPASAQPPAKREHARARTFLVVRIAEELGLPDDKALQVSAIIRKSDEQRSQLQGQRAEIGKKLQAGLTQSPPDATALSKLIAEANDVDHQLALLPEQSFREMQQILTVEQQAKLILFRPKLQNRVRRALQRRAETGAERPRPQPGAE